MKFTTSGPKVVRIRHDRVISSLVYSGSRWELEITGSAATAATSDPIAESPKSQVRWEAEIAGPATGTYLPKNAGSLGA